MNEETSNKYCWIKYFQTVMIWVGFFIFGACDCIRGPTILDLKDILNVEIYEISLIFTFFAMGSLSGCILSSLFLDKLKNYRFLVLGCSILLIGSSTAALPFSSSISMIYFLSVVSGFSSGVKMTGGNVLCTNLWRDNKLCSSFVHANQFAWSIGAFLAPIAAKPFLTHEPEKNVESFNATLEETNTHIEDVSVHQHSIRTLYPILGGACNMLFIGFVIAHFKDKEERKIGDVNRLSVNKTSLSMDGNLRKKISLTGILSLFLFIAIGSEVVFRAYLTVFAVESSLKLDMQEATTLSIIFFAPFALMRFLMIFLALRLSPMIILLISLIVSCFGSLVVILFGGTFLIGLQIGTGLLGLGFASLFSAGFLWFQSKVIMSNRIGGIFTFSGSAGAQTFLTFASQVIEKQPLCLPFTVLGSMTACMLLLGVAVLVARTGEEEQKEKQSKEFQETVELMDIPN